VRVLSTQKHVFPMVFKVLLIGPVVFFVWQPDLFLIELIVGFAVVELFVEAAAHLKSVVGIDGNVPAVVEFVDVGAEQDSVGDFVTALIGIGSDVGSFEDGQRVLPGDGTFTVNGSDFHAKTTLAESHAEEGGGAVAFAGFVNLSNLTNCIHFTNAVHFTHFANTIAILQKFHPIGGNKAIMEKTQPDLLFGAVRFPGNNLIFPVFRGSNPVLSRKESRVRNDNGPDRVVTGSEDLFALGVLMDGVNHGLQAVDAIPLPEKIPCIAYVHRLIHKELPESNNVPAVFFLKLKEKQLAFANGRKCGIAHRPPEIHLIHGLLAQEILVPMFVGIGNVEIHGNTYALFGLKCNSLFLFGLMGNRMGATHKKASSTCTIGFVHGSCKGHLVRGAKRGFKYRPKLHRII
jgi:hypothetical protein